MPSQTTENTTPRHQVLFINQILEEYFPVSARTLSRWIENGEFPSPNRLPSGRPFWQRSTVEEWIASRPYNGKRWR